MLQSAQEFTVTCTTQEYCLMSKFSFNVFSKTFMNPSNPMKLHWNEQHNIFNICCCRYALFQCVCPKTGLCVCQTSSHRQTWQTRGWRGRWWQASWPPSASWRQPSSSVHWQSASSTSRGGASSRGDEVSSALAGHTDFTITSRPLIYTVTHCTAHQIHTRPHYKLCTELILCWKCCGMRCAGGCRLLGGS